MNTLEPSPHAAFLTPSPVVPRPLSWLRPLRHPVVAAVLVAAVLHLLWAGFLATDGGDMAAQYAWAEFTGAHPGSAYNLSWYGGMHPISYSALTPYLMAWLGVRTTAVITGTLSAAVLARLLMRSGLARPLLPAVCGAVALSGDTASGRITFSIGVLFGLTATLMVYESFGPRAVRDGAAFLLGAVATGSSPVAGLFLLVAGAGLFLTGRRRDSLALLTAPPLVVGIITLLFPFYGVQPFSVGGAALVVATGLPVALWAPPSWRAVRAGAWVYIAGDLLTLLIPSPIGSNVERLSLLFAATVLLAALMEGARGRRALALWLAFVFAAGWQVVKPVQDLVSTAPAAGWSTYAKPLIAELGRLGADRDRVEVVAARTHWESAGLSPYVNLARGWNRQLDVERNPVFYDGKITAATYHAWLRTWAVSYVVLPDAAPDDAAVAEARIVAAGQTWLRPVWGDAHWRVYAVTDAVPLTSAPSTAIRAGQGELSMRVPQAGSFLVRVAWSPWLGVLHGTGCLEQAGAWTRLRAHDAGVFTIGSRYTLPRGTPCG
ncbi:MFS transporter [Streptomyces sp. RB6PN25]|uniref:MFS transporter n=1 Tax=Streptomyces humicola TaxID=2953240 RepID=A0ABT1Q313_9ACTN|nr:MFS transporter [Streptomyces humicola]MCQ4083710.1 MFS transporter [Streptomyces humicola]